MRYKMRKNDPKEIARRIGKGPISLKELAERYRVNHSTVWRWVNLLRKSGYTVIKYDRQMIQLMD